MMTKARLEEIKRRLDVERPTFWGHDIWLLIAEIERLNLRLADVGKLLEDAERLADGAVRAGSRLLWAQRLLKEGRVFVPQYAVQVGWLGEVEAFLKDG